MHFLKVYYDSVLNYVMKLVISLLWVIYLVCMQNFPWDLDLVPPPPIPLYTHPFRSWIACHPQNNTSRLHVTLRLERFPIWTPRRHLVIICPPKHSIGNVYRQWTKVSRMRPSDKNVGVQHSGSCTSKLVCMYVCVYVCLCMCVWPGTETSFSKFAAFKW